MFPRKLYQSRGEAVRVDINVKEAAWEQIANNATCHPKELIVYREDSEPSMVWEAESRAKEERHAGRMQRAVHPLATRPPPPSRRADRRSHSTTCEIGTCSRRLGRAQIECSSTAAFRALFGPLDWHTARPVSRSRRRWQRRPSAGLHRSPAEVCV